MRSLSVAIAMIMMLAALAPATAQPPAEGLISLCGQGPGAFNVLDVSPELARQGATLTLSPSYRMGPGSGRFGPDCISGWQVEPADQAEVSADGRTIRIADNATPGSMVIVRYLILGRQGAEVRLRIAGRDEVTLTGVRRQSSLEGCVAQTVGELRFTSDGQFSVTYAPFETYNDYWGAFTFDPATGALRMTVERGNHIPDNLDLEGRARFDSAGRLVLEGVYLGAHLPGRPPRPDSCRYIF